MTCKAGKLVLACPDFYTSVSLIDSGREITGQTIVRVSYLAAVGGVEKWEVFFAFHSSIPF
jgi:hypothetical protein